MIEILQWAGFGLLGLVAAAMVLAAWEHTQRQGSIARHRAEILAAQAEAARLYAEGGRGADHAERVAAMDRTFGRMAEARAPGGIRDPHWVETRPMINPQLAVSEESKGEDVDLLIG